MLVAMQTQLTSMAAELHDVQRAIDLVQRSENYGDEKLRLAFVVLHRVARAAAAAAVTAAAEAAAAAAAAAAAVRLSSTKSFSGAYRY